LVLAKWLQGSPTKSRNVLQQAQKALSEMAAVAGIGVVVVLTVIVTGSAIFQVYPRFIGQTVTAIRREPWKSLRLGRAQALNISG
jgi:uncharacterized protein YqhQ